MMELDKLLHVATIAIAMKSPGLICS